MQKRRNPAGKSISLVRTALVIGGEAEGASTQARSLATEMIRIPMPGHMESLNAGVAGAVLMYEVVRQRSR